MGVRGGVSESGRVWRVRERAERAERELREQGGGERGRG